MGAGLDIRGDIIPWSHRPWSHWVGQHDRRSPISL